MVTDFFNFLGVFFSGLGMFFVLIMAVLFLMLPGFFILQSNIKNQKCLDEARYEEDIKRCVLKREASRYYRDPWHGE